MLAARHRLRRRGEFEDALRRGTGTRRAGRPTLTVHLRLPAGRSGEPANPSGPGDGISRDAAPVRAGFIVSKAVGDAVVRNRVKRRLRALVAARLALVPPGSSLVVRAQPAAATASSALLAADLNAALAVAVRSPSAERFR